jgi:radical SAM superfamily enzyme YgiQ (UPF0313 family)
VHVQPLPDPGSRGEWAHRDSFANRSVHAAIDQPGTLVPWKKKLMNVLLRYPDLPVLFWIFEKLCRLAGAKSLVPPLGLITVAALLPDEWDLRLIDMNARPLTASDWDWAEMVLIWAMLPQHGGLFELLREAQERGKTTVVGGPFPASAPRETLEAGCDFLVKREGEITVPLFLSALREGKSRGVFESTRRPDLSETPVPRYDLLRLKDYVAVPVQIFRWPHPFYFLL